MGRAPQPAVDIILVAARVETLRSLRTYLCEAGLDVRARTVLSDFEIHRCSAFVLFPDDFAAGDVQRELLRMRLDRPRTIQLLITRYPARYAAISKAEGRGPKPVVIPKPAWGWTILDAIRSALEPP